MKKKIAVFTTGWCAEILSQFLAGMTKSLSDANADVFLFLCYPTFIDTDAIKTGEMNIYNLPDLHVFDGAVIFASGLDFKDRVDSIIERCKEAEIPIIMQGARSEGVSFVGSDNTQATKDLIDHLRNRHGVKSFSFFAGSKESYDSNLRLNAIRDYLKENNCEDELAEIYYTNWENAAVTRHVNELCAAGTKLPEAIVCANDGLAMECCISLNNNGFDVPGDVLVTGFDYVDYSQVFYPSIASVDQCFEEMGVAAIKLWRELINGAEPGSAEVIKCKYVPGESCNCFDHRNSDKLRRQMGRENFSKRAMTTYFNRKLDIIDSTVLACSTYPEFKENMNKLLTNNHDYEGDSFHVLLEPNFARSIFDSDIRLSTNGYSRKMEVLYSSEDGVKYEEELFETSKLIPGYDGNGANHLYVFLPLHEGDSSFGYIVFRDCFEKVNNRFLHDYENRVGLVFDKFRHALTMDQINKRLIDIMRRDPLTNVSNRMAFDDKEKSIQAQINSDPEVKFAIAMFDVNSLKLINDTLGHEAGDKYLLRACHLICDVFKHSPVFRMGGDEFVAVLTGEDYENRYELLAKINASMSPYSNVMPLPDDYVSIAVGLSEFIPDFDMSVTDVNKRADENMYRDKAAKKGRK